MPTNPMGSLPSLQAARRALQAGQPAAAVTCLTRLISAEQASGEVYELLGIAHFMLGDRVAARQSLEQATQIEPGRATAHYNYALVLVEDNAIYEAHEEVDVALYLAPSHPGALDLRNRLAQRLKELRDHSHDEFTIIGRGRDPVHEPVEEWAKITCPSCGEKNFITAIACVRCHTRLLPEEEEEIRPVE